MKIISIINNKGGVGKTTTSFNLAHYLANNGRRVLVVDLDSQKNLTTNLTKELIDKPSIGDYLLERIEFCHPTIINSNLHLISSGNTEEDITLLSEEGTNAHKKLDEFLKTIEAVYDVVIIDTAPSFNLYTRSAMHAGRVYCVLNAGQNEIKGMKATEIVLSKYNKKLEGIILIKKDISKLFESTKDYLQKQYQKTIFNTVIRKNIALAESIFENKSVFEYSPRSNGAKDYKALSEEIIEREGLQ